MRTSLKKVERDDELDKTASDIKTTREDEEPEEGN